MGQQRIQKMLMNRILSPIGAAMGKLSQKTRDWMFLIGGVGIVLHYFLRSMEVVPYRFVIFFAISCLFLGLMILGGMGTEMKPLKINWFLAVPWVGVGVFTLVSGLLYNVDYLPEAVLFLIAFPVLFICWGNADRQHVLGLLIRLCKIAAVMFVLGSFLFAQITARRYPGLFLNTNQAAYFLAVVSVGLIADLMYLKTRGWKLAFDIVMLGLVSAMSYYTNSRTGFLAVICAALLGVVMYLLTHAWKDSWKRLLRLGAGVLAAVVFSLSLFYVFQIRQWLPIPYFDTQQQTFYVDARWENLWDRLTGGEPGGTPGGIFDISGYEDIFDNKLDTTDKSADQISTGRISIWKTYAKDLNWFGHAETPKIYSGLLYKEISSTHMTILQVAYESGIFAGVLYLLMNLVSGLWALSYAWKNRREDYALAPLILIVAFGVLSMLGSCRVAFWHFETLMYYLVLFPLMTKKPDEIR